MKFKLIHPPSRTVNLFLDSLETFERQLGEKITIEQDPNRMRKSDRGHLLGDISRLKQYLGWEPGVSIDEGIGTLVEG